MKKETMTYKALRLIGLLCLMVAAGSCGRPEVEQTTDFSTEPITMNGSTSDASSRAGAGEFLLDNSHLQETGFGVYCWFTGNDDFTLPSDVGSRASDATYMMLMRNQKIEHTASAWTYSPHKYWPLTDSEKLTFRAYAPYTSYIYTEADGMPRMPVTVSATDYSDDNQHDPLFGTDADGLPYENVTRPADNTVHWYFHHGMAKLVFSGLVSPDYRGSEDYVLRVTSITITPLYTEGLLNIASSTSTGPGDKPVWESRDGDMTVELGSSDLRDINLYGSVDYQALLDHGLLIIPRDYTSAPVLLTITYETEHPGGSKSVSATLHEHFYGNTVYDIQLLFNPRTDVVSISLSIDLNWQTGSYNYIPDL